MANTRTGPDFLDRISDNTHRTDGKKKLLDMMKKNFLNRNKKKRPSKLMEGSFPTPPKRKPPKPKPPKAPKTPERTAKARTGSFPVKPRKPKSAPAAAAMKAATLALLKKKKKK